MPAMTIRQSASASSSRTSSSRCRPATPTSPIAWTRAPWTRAVSIASAVTGASEVPAATTVTSPARLGHRPEDGGPGDLVDDGVRQSVAHRVLRIGGEPGRENRPVGVPVVQPTEDPDHLLGRLAGAVHHLRVAGTTRAVDVEPGVAQVVGAAVVSHGSRRPGRRRSPSRRS